MHCACSANGLFLESLTPLSIWPFFFADYPSFHLTLCKISLLICWIFPIYFTNGMCSGAFLQRAWLKTWWPCITWHPQSLGYQVSLSKTCLIFANHTHFLIISKCCYLIPRYRECQHLPPILEACNHLPLLSFPTNLQGVTNHIE